MNRQLKHRNASGLSGASAASLAPRLTLSLGLFMLVGGACGKDAPPVAPSVAADGLSPSPSPSQLEAPASESPAGQGPANPKAAPAAPTKATTPHTSDSSLADPPTRALEPITLPNLHGALISVVGTPSLSALAQTMTAGMAQFGASDLMPQDSTAALKDLLQGQFSLESMDWLAMDRPAWGLLPDPKRYPRGFVAVLPINTPGAVPKVKKPGASAPTTGPALTFTPTSDGHYLLITNHAEAAETLKPWVQTTLLKWTPPHAVVIEASTEHFNRVFAQEMTLAEGLVGRMGEDLAKRAALERQAALVRGLAAGAFNILRGTKRIGLAFTIEGGYLRFGMGFIAGDNTGLHGVIETLAKDKPSNTARLDPDAWLTWSSHLDPALTAPSKASVAGRIAAANPTLPAAKQAQFVDAIMAVLAVQSGDSAFAIASDGVFPAAFTSVASVTDGHGAFGATLRVLEHVWEVVTTRQDPEGKLLPKSARGIGQVIALVNQVSAETGMSLKAVRDTTEDNSHSLYGLRLKVDWAIVGPLLKGTQELALARAFLGDKFEVALGHSPTHLALTLGPNAVMQLRAVLDATPGGGEPNAMRLASRSAGALSLLPGRLLFALRDLPQLADRKAAIAQLPTGQALTLSVASDGTILSFEVETPIPLVKALMTLQ